MEAVVFFNPDRWGQPTVKKDKFYIIAYFIYR